MMFKQLGIVAFSIFYCGMVINFVHANTGKLQEKNITVTAPVKVTMEEKEEILTTVDSVYTPYGEFKHNRANFRLRNILQNGIKN